jgi:NAD-dependent dihydropyrimidine dehydrogenase PreA subunit
MIEVIDRAQCTGCNICVLICPVNVFEAVENDIPLIARQSDCQTCYMCEAYCPVDALYVAPQADEPISIDATHIPLRGSYRRAIGWTKESKANRASDMSYRLLGPR